MVTAPRARKAARARSTAARGTSSWRRAYVRVPAGIDAAAASARLGSTDPFAPGTTTIRFAPESSISISAVPVAPARSPRSERSRPSRAR
jgi:hypothetical protein